ncbi:hypothetical protein HDU98_005785 [Podochytrium sp. JEL0797]|nr:hypothetical protein HDU98_005785 [Podochytrium sp. JEL0797]
MKAKFIFPLLVVSCFKSALALDFAWGFGGSSYQTEGGWNVDEKEPSVYDHWYNQSPLHRNAANANVTADQYHRFHDDLAILPQLGATLYRFSVSWPRVMNNCTSGGINPKGIAFYNAMIDQVVLNGATPFLTMFHWDLPQACFEQFQGFSNDQIIDNFLQYADLLFSAFGDRVKYWLTVNEAESNCKFGYQQGRLAPGMVNASYQSTIDCVYRTHRLHAAVVNLARTKYGSVAKGWKFGFPSNVEWNEPPTNSTADVTAANNRNLAYAAWFHDPLVFGTYQSDMVQAFQTNPGNLDAMGTAPPAFSAADSALLKGSIDFISMNYYSTAGLPTSQQDVASGAGCGLANMCWQFVWGQGARKMANWYYQRYGMDIIITEVGFAALGEAQMTINEVVSNTDRVAFWKSHAQAIAEAVEVDGVPIKGVLVWSLLDNFEWGYYDQRFGAVAVVGIGEIGGSLERVVKNATYWLADFYRQKNYNNPFVGQPVSTGMANISGQASYTSASSPGSKQKSSSSLQLTPSIILILIIVLAYA